MRFLIAYDIADPGRLQRVARNIERRAVRRQKSVFLFHGSPGELTALLDSLAPLMDLREDILQAWKLSPDQADEGEFRGSPVPVEPAALVCDPEQTYFVARPRKPSAPPPESGQSPGIS